MNYVLPDEVTQPISTDEFLAVQIVNVKQTSHIIKVLNEKYPLHKHKHLRRVKSVQLAGKKTVHILICLSSDAESKSSTAHHMLLKDSVIDLDDLAGECYYCQASSKQPITRAQYEQCKAVWPTFFHEDPQLEGKLGLIQFSEFDKYCVATAEDLATRSTGSYKCGAVIADTVQGVVMGVGSSLSDEHPLKHAVMVAIDSVSHGQGGGVWSSTVPAPSSKHSSKMSTDVYTAESKKRPLEAEVNGEYICTGYTAYLSHEPCTMCTMSLLHSRIKHVYYDSPTQAGALGTLYKLHCNPQLNHNFTVTTRAPVDSLQQASQGLLIPT